MAPRRITATLSALALASTASAQAQPSEEANKPSGQGAPASGANVVSQAEDAFGFRAGPEESGLYDAGDVRGFDPIAAGNIRVEGLYAELQGAPSDRLSPQSAIRVGAATAGSLLSAPTGLVDYSLAAADGAPFRVRVARESFGLLVGEADAVLRDTSGRWSLNAGASISTGGDDFRGTRPTSMAGSLVARWQPAQQLRLTAFHDVARARRNVEPFYYPAGDVPPPRVPRGVFLGQPWSDYRYMLRHFGLIVEVANPLGLFFKGGAFHSTNRVAVDTFDLFEGVDGNGTGQRSAYLFPPQSYRSISGEAQLGYRWGSRMRQQVVLAVRARRGDAQYGGEVSLDLGRGSIFEAGTAARVSFPRDGAQIMDRTAQATWIAQYRLQSDRFDIDASAARTSYSKDVALPDVPRRESRSQPWLYSLIAGWRPDAATLVYISGSRGLEASGVAPSAALNRNEILPAIVTRQREFGIKRAFGSIKTAASLFRITKPYASLDGRGVFALNGTVHHTGVEASASGPLGSGIDLLAGLVLLRARASGPPVEAGLLSPDPIGVPRLRGQLGLNYAPPSLPRQSFDLVVDYRGTRVADLDGRSRLPGYAQVDVGTRYRVLGDDRLVLRAQVLNLFDVYAATVARDGAFFYSPGRSLRLSLTVQAGSNNK